MPAPPLLPGLPPRWRALTRGPCGSPFCHFRSSTVGLTLTPALIRGWGGLPQLGVTSAAWGTVVSMALALLWLGWYLRRKKSPLAPDAQQRRHLRVEWKLLKPVLQLGLPIGLMMNVLLTGSLIALAAVFARDIAGLFITSTPVLDPTQTVLRISLFFGLASVFSGVMRASGVVLVPTLISLACLIAILSPTGWLLSRAVGVHGVWMAYPITFFCALLMQAAYYRWVWRCRPIVRLV